MLVTFSTKFAPACRVSIGGDADPRTWFPVSVARTPSPRAEIGAEGFLGSLRDDAWNGSGSRFVDSRRPCQARGRYGFVSVLVLGALWATVQLIDDLIHGGPETNSASDLLEAGSIVWVSNNIAFALLYWELDGGGAAARAHHLPAHADFAFPQQLNPKIATPDWRPRFIDYLYLGFTNATAFSPTDAMPLAPWAKIAMAVQSLVSLAILGLVIARAVNVFA